MKNLNLDNVQEAADFKQVTPGGYVCMITAVEDVPEKEYLKLEYDILEGEFKCHYSELYKARGFWGGTFVKSYKDKALPFFKAFTTSAEASNKGYKWDSDETKLRGKLIGLVLAEEEYRKNDGTIGTRLYVDRPRSADAIRAGDFKVPAKKLLPESLNATAFPELKGDDTDCPF